MGGWGTLCPLEDELWHIYWHRDLSPTPLFLITHPPPLFFINAYPPPPISPPKRKILYETLIPMPKCPVSIMWQSQVDNVHSKWVNSMSYISRMLYWNHSRFSVSLYEWLNSMHSKFQSHSYWQSFVWISITPPTLMFVFYLCLLPHMMLELTVNTDILVLGHHAHLPCVMFTVWTINRLIALNHCIMLASVARTGRKLTFTAALTKGIFCGLFPPFCWQFHTHSNRPFSHKETLAAMYINAVG